MECPVETHAASSVIISYSGKSRFRTSVCVLEMDESLQFVFTHFSWR